LVLAWFFFLSKIYVFIISNFLQWYEKFTDVDEVIPVSAKYGQGVEDVKDWILSKIPNGPAYYPKACQKSEFCCPHSNFIFAISLTHFTV